MLVGILVVGVYIAGVVLVGGEDARKALSAAAVPPLVGTFLLQVVVLLAWPQCIERVYAPVAPTSGTRRRCERR